MKIATVVGARPQFIKAGILSKTLRKHIKEVLIHTGQHYDSNMSEVFFQQLSMAEPDYSLKIGSGSHGKQTGQMLAEIEDILLREKPNYVLVYGDTNSTLAGSLAAAKLHIPIIHVEAGLRSYNRQMPEEINRVLTDHLSTLLFCPTETAVNNLANEGIQAGVHQVGDIMYDSILHYHRLALQRSTIHKQLDIASKPYILATIHRAENTDHPFRLQAILEALHQLEQTVVLPMHPRTRKCIQEASLVHLLKHKHLIITEPLSYLDMLALLAKSRFVMTDSGGIQREAYMLRIPCITLRDETEWPETVQAGWNQIAGAHRERILHCAHNLQLPEAYPALFGDGQTAAKISNIILAN